MCPMAPQEPLVLLEFEIECIYDISETGAKHGLKTPSGVMTNAAKNGVLKILDYSQPPGEKSALILC